MAITEPINESVMSGTKVTCSSASIYCDYTLIPALSSSMFERQESEPVRRSGKKRHKAFYRNIPKYRRP